MRCRRLYGHISSSSACRLKLLLSFFVLFIKNSLAFFRNSLSIDFMHCHAFNIDRRSKFLFFLILFFSCHLLRFIVGFVTTSCLAFYSDRIKYALAASLHTRHGHNATQRVYKLRLRYPKLHTCCRYRL